MLIMTHDCIISRQVGGLMSQCFHGTLADSILNLSKSLQRKSFPVKETRAETWKHNSWNTFVHTNG